jgi:hypothetical protein
MSQLPRLGDGSTALCRCLIRKAETEKDNPQVGFGVDVGVISSLVAKRAVGKRIIKRLHLFQMEPGGCKTAHKHQVSPGGHMAQNQARGIAALSAEAQQILAESPCHIGFAA